MHNKQKESCDCDCDCDFDSMESCCNMEEEPRKFVYGVSIQIGSDGIPHINQFGNLKNIFFPQFRNQQRSTDGEWRKYLESERQYHQ